MRPRGNRTIVHHAEGEHYATESLVIVGLLSIVCIMAWHVPSASGQATAEWVTLFDGTHLDHWHPIGDANWRLEDGVVVADKGSGFLVSKEAYADFQLRVEFWVDEDANSGIFIRCTILTRWGPTAAMK